MVDYLVDTPDGSVGIVEGWERDDHGRPQALVVAQGWFGRHRLEVPLEALVEIDHEDRRITLARGAAPVEPKRPLQRLVELAIALGLKPEVLPFSNLPGFLPPYWLAPHLAMRVA